MDPDLDRDDRPREAEVSSMSDDGLAETTSAATASRLYEAINARDPKAILSSLSDDFVGELSRGMPLGVGGRHAGRDPCFNTSGHRSASPTISLMVASAVLSET